MNKAMTIGQLARRTGVSIRALREYDALGLVYGLGRSGSNYRLFDESALWCLQMIGSLRSLGLTPGLRSSRRFNTAFVASGLCTPRPWPGERNWSSMLRIRADSRFEL